MIFHPPDQIHQVLIRSILAYWPPSSGFHHVTCDLHVTHVGRFGDVKVTEENQWLGTGCSKCSGLARVMGADSDAVTPRQRSFTPCMAKRHYEAPVSSTGLNMHEEVRVLEFQQSVPLNVKNNY